MGIISTIKAVSSAAKTVKAVKFMTSAGGSIISEVNKGIKGNKAANRMEELENSYAFELIFEKANEPYIDGARLYDATKSINLCVSAFEKKGARCLMVTDANGEKPRFTIVENRSQYRWNGESQSTSFTITTDGLWNSKLELHFGGTFWKYSLPAKDLHATESTTGYKVVNSKKDVVAETVGKFRSESTALVYIRDDNDFNLCIAMLFAPIFFQGIMAPENFSEDYEKYTNKMNSRRGLL